MDNGGAPAALFRVARFFAPGKRKIDKLGGRIR